MLAAFLVQLIVAQSVLASTTIPLSDLPLAGYNLVKPNLIFGYDDSGSMDNELILPTNGGTLWFDQSSRTFWNATGVFNVNDSRTGHEDYWYLFPNGSSSSSTTDKRRYSDSIRSYSIPPVPYFAALRSAAYNPLYYDPAVRYRPWPAGYVGGSLRTFADATPTAARWHPIFQGTPPIDLTAMQSSSTTDWTFRFPSGSVIPGATIAGIRARLNGSGTFNPVTTDLTVGNGEFYDAEVPYYPASYWIVDAGCASGPNCSTAPDGKKLRLITIRSSTASYAKAAARSDCITLANACSYAEELQNFANWFQYHRKRRLAMAAGFGQALSDARGIRGGLAFFNNRTTTDVDMYDFADSDPARNGQRLMGMVYESDSWGGTPTRGVLKYIGSQFGRSDPGAPIQVGCQRNAAMIATDGYANDIDSAPPYDRARWLSARPFSVTPPDSISDIAGAYYTINPRPDLPGGLLRPDPPGSRPNPNQNTDLHMNTYALTLGAIGTIYGTTAPQALDPFKFPPDWPVPMNSSPTAIDDLWHATINGRGEMYRALNATDVTRALNAVVGQLAWGTGSDAGIALSTPNISAGNNVAYVSSYNGQDWSGELAAYPVNISTGGIDTSPGKELWKAGTLLTARTPGSRIIVSHDGATAVPFASAGGGLPTALVNGLALTATPNDGAQVLAYLRGDRSGEGTRYRVRTKLLGDIVSADPVIQNGVIYQAANDGMLHAFDASTGAELWAYVPFNVLPRLKHLANPLYAHRFFVDGTPTIQTMDRTRTLLVGGLRGGGPGYYAIDVTNPRLSDESSLAGKVLWELPNAGTPQALRDQLGASYGKPVIVKTESGQWVVLLTSGYNNASGQSHLHVLDAVTGSLIRTLTPPTGFGLAQVSAWVADPTTDSAVDFVYGGDLRGNVWRFDLRGAPASWNVALLAALGSTKPITSAPELVRIGINRVVIVGTGRLLADADRSDNTPQSVYALKDNLTATPTISDPRGSTMQKQTVSLSSGDIRTISSTAVNWATMNGWYFDLPAGERVSTDPNVAFGALVFTTNTPSQSTCFPSSYLYAVNVENGGQFPAAYFPGSSAWSGRQVGGTFASRAVLYTLPTGRLVSVTHRSDAALYNAVVPTNPMNQLRRHAWREVLR